MSDPNHKAPLPSRDEIIGRRQNLSQERIAALNRRIQVAHSEQTPKPVIPHREDLEEWPLSFAQERIFFLQQLEPENSVQNRPLALRLVGQLKPDVLLRTLTAIVHRHSVLRGKYALVDGTPRLTIQAHPEIELKEYDICSDNPEERFERAQTMMMQEAQRPFRLLHELPLRFFLFKLGDEVHILLSVFHHIVFDGWSARIFERDLAAFYAAFLIDHSANLPELLIQYTDFALWQREKVNDPSLVQHLVYWKERLNELPDPIELSGFQGQVELSGSEGGKIVRDLSHSLSRRLREFSRSEKTTLFTILLTAFNILLHRYSGQSDLVIGTPISGRTTLETEPLIGCFLNTLVLRANLRRDLSFRQLLQQAAATTQDAFTYQQTPFERLVQELNPSRDLSRTTIFQVLFNLENIPPVDVPESEIRIEPLDFDSGHSQFDLNLEIIPQDQDLRTSFTYKKNVLKHQFVEMLAAHYQNLLESILADPDQRIGVLPLLSALEMRHVIEDFNNPLSPVAVNLNEILCLHQMFENQVEQTPQADALVCNSGSITYAELNAQANQIAHLLLEKGVPREAPVGIFLDRSPALAAAILGVLKAGAVYVPMDPNYPPARLETTIRDSDLKLAITSSALVGRLPEVPIETACLDELQNSLERLSQGNPLVCTDPGGPAYIIYTSGTTGNPKGILALHQGAANYLVYLKKAFGLDEHTVGLAISSVSVDPHVRDLLGPLTSGGRVVLLAEEEARNPRAILKKILKYGVNTILTIVPTLLRTILEIAGDERAAVDGLELLFSGGEILTWQDCRKARTVFGPHLQIVNQYAPSEFSMACTMFRIPFVIPDDNGLPPIGKPIINGRAYILDAYQNPQPPGVAGEIYTAGLGVAKGYINLPNLTAERFLADPFVKQFPGRMYRTGDFGRYLPDGNIEFLGRRDFQVKIRGYRVETAEVEAVLMNHPSVRKAVVTSWQRKPGEAELAAYIMLEQDMTLTSDALRRYTSLRLPDYMIPSTFVFLDEIPLTPSGKIDRKALPVITPETIHAWQETENNPLQTPTEFALAQIWQEVLGVAPESAQADFFTSGGHSLLALRLFMQIENQLGLSLPLAAIFQQPTLGGLARLLDKTTPEVKSWIIGLETNGDQKPFFFINTAFDFTAMFIHIRKALPVNQPFYIVQIPNPELADQDIPWLARQAIDHIRKIQAEGPYLLGGYSLSGLFAYEIARQLCEAGKEVALLALIDTRIYRLPDYQRFLTPWQRIRYRAGFLIYTLRLHLRNLYQLKPKQGWDYLTSRIRKRMIQQPTIEIPPEEAIWAELRQLIPKYQLKPYQCRISLLKASRLPDHELEPGWFFERETLGWQKIPGVIVDVISIPGDHLSILSAANFSEMAATLVQCIQETHRKNLSSEE